MKPKRSKKNQSAGTGSENGQLVDVFEGVKHGEVKEIAEGLWVVNTGIVLDPPEPIKKPGKTKPKKKSA
jgi:hypothetical protein